MVAGDRNDIFAGAVIEFLSRAVPVGGAPVQPAHALQPYAKASRAICMTCPEGAVGTPRHEYRPRIDIMSTTDEASPSALPSRERYRSAFRAGLFDGRTVVVTGGGSGIGRCTAHELAQLGAHVVLAGRKKEKLRRSGRRDRRGWRRRLAVGLRHPRRGGGQARRGRHRRGARPHRRPGQQRRRAVPGAAGDHLREGLRGGGAPTTSPAASWWRARSTCSR